MTGQPKVVVAMSGGVDSSVAAALLVEQGYQVIGMMMRLWSEKDSEQSNRCCTPDAMAQARRVAAILEIPFYAVDAQKIFHQAVVQSFIDGYAQGITPNPCLVCNRQVRWGFLMEQSLVFGADFMATGHYVRLQKDTNDLIQLLRAIDSGKDQSYVLHILGQGALQHSIFPLGEYTKSEVRSLAHKFGLPVAERADSQDLCFLGTGDYRAFLQRNAPTVQQPGPILNKDGHQIGQHNGLAFYTNGQRKGLGISASKPLYVLDKDIGNNALIVGPREALGQSELTTHSVNWVAGSAPSQAFDAQIKIRYKAAPANGRVTPLNNGGVHIKFVSPLRDITPDQAAVIYDGQICLGGGIIQRELNTLS